MKSKEAPVLIFEGVEITPEFIDSLCDIKLPEVTPVSRPLEAALTDPDLGEYRQHFQYLIGNLGKKNLTPEKDLAEERDKARYKLAGLYAENPALPAKEALCAVLQALPPKYPTEMILPLVKFVLKECRRLKSMRKVRELAYA